MAERCLRDDEGAAREYSPAEASGGRLAAWAENGAKHEQQRTCGRKVSSVIMTSGHESATVIPVSAPTAAPPLPGRFMDSLAAVSVKAEPLQILQEPPGEWIDGVPAAVQPEMKGEEEDSDDTGFYPDYVDPARLCVQLVVVRGWTHRPLQGKAACAHPQRETHDIWTRSRYPAIASLTACGAGLTRNLPHQGIPVGKHWALRVHCAADRVHAPLVGGAIGRSWIGS